MSDIISKLQRLRKFDPSANDVVSKTALSLKLNMLLDDLIDRFKVEENPCKDVPITGDGLCKTYGIIVYDGDRIIAVQRLSDGVVFRKGDYVKKDTLPSWRGTIENFHISSDRRDVFIFVNDINVGFISSVISINSCTKLGGKPIPSPLFTTDDGVDIYPNMRYWLWSGSFLTSVEARENYNLPPDYYRFSTKEKANEYITKALKSFTRK